MKTFFKNIIENILESDDENQQANLIRLAIDSLSEISDDSSYYILEQLISLNEELDNPIENIEELLFIKCNEEYRYRMWEEEYVNICPINLLKENLQNKEENLSTLYDKVGIEDIQTEVVFEDIEETVLKELKTASETIKVAMAWFTNPSIFKQLINLLKKGIDISILTNNDLVNNGGHSLNFQKMIDAGANLFLVNEDSLMHHKFCIIDDKTIINGSYNWTISAEYYNYENILIIRNNTKLVHDFVKEFDDLTNSLSKVDTMPDSVPERLKYDRLSYKYTLTTELIDKADSAGTNTLKKRYYFEALSVSNDDFVRQSIPEQYLKEFDNSPLSVKYKNERSITDELVKQETDKLLSNLSQLDIKKERISLKIEKLKQREQKICTQFKRKINDKKYAKSEIEIKKLKNQQRKEIQKIKKVISQETAELTTIQKNCDIFTSQLDLNQAAADTHLKGSRGAMRINLLWKTTDDLDLHLILPNSNEIYYKNMTENYKGHEVSLDYDANAAEPYTEDPQENITWLDKMPDGEYEICVVLYKYRSNVKNLSFVITIIPDMGTPVKKTYAFTDLEDGAKLKIGTIKYDYQKGMIFLNS